MKTGFNVHCFVPKLDFLSWLKKTSGKVYHSVLIKTDNLITLSHITLHDVGIRTVKFFYVRDQAETTSTRSCGAKHSMSSQLCMHFRYAKQREIKL